VALLKDHVAVVAKLEGVEPEQAEERIWKSVHEIVEQDGWGLYATETEEGTALALGVIFHKMLFKVAPVPVLTIPMEVEDEKPVKKKRKRYL
jgi:hypothetical protein